MCYTLENKKEQLCAAVSNKTGVDNCPNKE